MLRTQRLTTTTTTTKSQVMFFPQNLMMRVAIVLAVVAVARPVRAEDSKATSALDSLVVLPPQDWVLRTTRSVHSFSPSTERFRAGTRAMQSGSSVAEAPEVAQESASLRELLSPFFAAEEFSRTPFVSLRTGLGQTTSGSSVFKESPSAESLISGLLASGDDDAPRSAVLRVELLDTDGLSPALERALADAKEKVFDPVTAWSAHIYISASGAAALGNHTDVTDVVVWQLTGRKQWLRCAPDDEDLDYDVRRKRDECATYSGMWRRK